MKPNRRLFQNRPSSLLLLGATIAFALASGNLVQGFDAKTEDGSRVASGMPYTDCLVSGYGPCSTDCGGGGISYVTSKRVDYPRECGETIAR